MMREAEKQNACERACKQVGRRNAKRIEGYGRHFWGNSWGYDSDVHRWRSYEVRGSSPLASGAGILRTSETPSCFVLRADDEDLGRKWVSKQERRVRSLEACVERKEKDEARRLDECGRKSCHTGTAAPIQKLGLGGVVWLRRPC